MVPGGDRGYRPAKGPDAAAVTQTRRQEAERTAHRLGLKLSALREQGIVSHAALARALTQRSVPTPKASRVWMHTTVGRLVDRTSN
jgi:hypothetical protein